MFIFMPEWLFFLIIGMAIIVGIIKLLCLFLEASIILSKITVSLVVAMALHSALPLGSSGFLSYIIWAAVSIAGLFLLCKLPRFDCAFEFFSKVIVAVVVGTLVASFALEQLKLESNAMWETITDIALRLTVLAASIYFTWQRFVEADFGKFSNVVLVNIDRVMASILYTFAVASLIMGSFVTSIKFPQWLSDVIILTLPVVFFLVDLFVISKKRIGRASVS